MSLQGEAIAILLENDFKLDGKHWRLNDSKSAVLVFWSADSVTARLALSFVDRSIPPYVVEETFTDMESFAKVASIYKQLIQKELSSKSATRSFEEEF